jgi:isoleucyl-tRNA synthetase
MRYEKCEYHMALSKIEEFVINHLSRQYVPIIRRNLWSDVLEAQERRFTIYATLWYVLKTIVALINPVTPFLSETIHQKVYRELNETLSLSINFEEWPKLNESLLDTNLEEEFDLMLKSVSLVYSARQSGQLKRRWPLRKVRVLAAQKVLQALRNLEEVFLELINVKKGEYIGLPQGEEQELDDEEWISNSDDGVTVLLYRKRDEALLGEGIVRDIARRVQTLRKDLGFMPTDILESVHIAELEESSAKLIEPLLNEMNDLVRTRKVLVHEKKDEVDIDWHESRLNNSTIYIAIE